MTDALKRRIGPGLLTAYGVGVMVGAGIYVLVGAVAAQVGVYAPVAFLLAGLIAAPSALSYAELSTRIPEAAGEAAYVSAGFARFKGRIALGQLVGLCIALAGGVSAAAVLRGGAGYLTGFVDIPFEVAVIGLGVFLTLVALVGVLESLALAAVFTVIEITGLCLVVWSGLSAPVSADWIAPSQLYMPGLGVAATLAFFAFIGFEDIVNLAEEVRRPSRTLPIAIIASLIITTALYSAVTFVAVRAVPIEALAASERPLALVFEAGSKGPVVILSAIAVFAALNGVLAQVVMAARVLYGLGKSGGIFGVFHHAHERFGTPVAATLLIAVGVIAGALTLPLSGLARVTSVILLGVFVLVNASLVMLKRREPDAPFRVSPWVPKLGLTLALLALASLTLEGAP